MSFDYWKKQNNNEPLYPDILWSRPESKAGAGKLAVIGGHSHGFGAPGIAWNVANESGVGVCNVLLPDAIKKTVKHVLPEAEYAPSNPSGSFSKKALVDFLEIANWSDATLIAGDLGRNSETAVLLENFVQQYTGPLAITQDSADYFKEYPNLLLERPDTVLVDSIAQLQKIFINAPLITPITYGMTLPQLVEALHGLTEKFPICVVVKHGESIVISSNGDVVSSNDNSMPWRVKTASRATVFWLQNPTTKLEAIISSLFKGENTTQT